MNLPGQAWQPDSDYPYAPAGPASTTMWIQGIDCLRALMSVCVVIWHMGGSGRSLIFSRERYADHTFVFSDLVNFHLLLLAVPAFVLIANYLFAAQNPDVANTLRRVKRYLLLFTFWTFAYLIFAKGFDGLAEVIPGSLADYPAFVLKGCNTIYYFFVCLIFTTVLVHWTTRLSTAVVGILAVGVSVFLFLMPMITKWTGVLALSAFWNPMNFLPYPFVAVLLTRMHSLLAHRRAGMFAAAAVLSFLFAIIEWNIYPGAIFLSGQPYAMPAYARISLVFAATALLIVSLSPKIPPNRVVGFMAKYSLALYCLHPFLIGPVTGGLSGGALLTLDSAQLAWFIFLVILLSYLAPFILKYYLREELLR